MRREAEVFVPRYSSDIAAAWRAVEKMLERGCLFGLSRDYPAHDDKWVAEFPAGPSDGEGETAPLAIARAALLAVLAEREAEARA